MMKHLPETEKAIYYEALGIQDAERRAAYLQAVCRDDVKLKDSVQSLLDADTDAGSFLNGSAIDSVLNDIERTEDSGLSETVGTIIGPYKLLEKIGEGGFGVVYMADQLRPVQRRVALKIIKPGMDTKQVIARFEAERQALALMEHPNIAKVFEAGTTETGRPYFVMELVRGVPITEYCNDQGLSTEDRLVLFMNTCSAIQHAHQKGIIHRDIKPGNILVTTNGDKPVPKVIDFGIAKATQGRLTDKTLFTNFRQFIGTPAYMSPEQAQMSAVDVDTRSDIYSLGVMLYELLTGTTPLDAQQLQQAGFEELFRRIREELPSKPSTRISSLSIEERTTLARQRHSDSSKLVLEIRGDLDWIVMKAIEKDRSRRYGTTSELQNDIQRFLRDEPISAMPPTASYLVLKFMTRNRRAIVVATMMVSLMIVGTAISTWQAIRANRSAVVANSKSVEALAAQEAAIIARKASEDAQRRETKQRVRAEQLKYCSDMMVAQAAYEAASLNRAREILESFLPQEGAPDWRGWEWHFLYSALTTPEEAVKCHDDTIDKIAVSSDGELIAISGKDVAQNRVRIIKLIRSDNLHLVDSFEGTTGWCDGLRFAVDDTSLTVEKNSVMRYDLASRKGQEWKPDEGTHGHFRPARLTPDGKYWLGMQRSGEENIARAAIRCYDMESEKLLFSTEAYLLSDPYWLEREFIVSPDGKLVTVSCDRRLLRILSVPDLEEVGVIATPGDTDTLAWSPDSKYLVTGYEYPWQYDVWEVSSRTHVHRLAGTQTSPCSAVCFSSDGSLVAFSEHSSRIHLWELEILTERGVFLVPPSRSIEFLPDNERLVCGGVDGTLRILDVSGTGKTDLKRISNENALWNLDFSPDGKILAVSAADGIVRFFDADTERLIDIMGPASDFSGTPQGDPHARIKFSADGRTLVVDNNDNTAGVFDVLSRTHRCNVVHSGMVYDLDISPDSKTIATAGIHNTVIFFDAKTGEEQDRITEHDEFKIDSVRFSPGPKSRLVAFSGSGNGRTELSLLSLDTKERSTIPTKLVWSLSFSPDGKTLYCGCQGSVEIYEIPSLKHLGSLKGRGGPIPNITLAPDGTVAIPSWGGNVQLWSRKVNAEVGHLPLPVDSMTSAKFSPDGSKLAVSTRGNGIFMFRAPSFVRGQ